MKYYKFNKDYDWDFIENAVEEAEEIGVSCDDLENAMFELMQESEPVDVDDIDEEVDGLYVDDEEIDKSLGEENEYVFGYVVHDGDTIYEFEFEKQ